MSLDLVKTLSDLVALPSVNPMGEPVEGPEYFEARVTDYLEQLFRTHKLSFERQTVAPGRDNILVRVDGDTPLDQGGQLVLLEAHQDTVPVKGMTIDPWKPVVRDGRLYGRGACDVKGGMAAMLGAVVRLSEERPAGRPTVVLACTVGEEYGHVGVVELPKLWEQGSKLLPRRPDLAIVAEPTLLQVVIAHRGVVRWKLHTRGKAAHSSQPHLGENAIYKMARVIAALEHYAKEVAPTLAEHHLCVRPTLSVGVIAGGVSVNTVPDHVVIDIDRRVLPGEKPAAVYQHVIDHLSQTLGDIAEHSPPYIFGGGLNDDNNGPLAERLAAVAREVTGSCEKIGVPYGTDAAVTGEWGVPSVVFGPGSIDQAHTCDEWLSLDQLAKASEILYRFLKQTS